MGTMHQNVENVLERDSKLGEIEERVDVLQDDCVHIELQTDRMKKNFCMRNLKAIIAVSVLFLIVLGLLYWKFFMDTPPPPGIPKTIYSLTLFLNFS